MSPLFASIVILIYFGLLVVISFFTSKGSSNASFFSANKNSPWYVVAFGMIGASLSGVTFISVPGEVGVNQFAYMQVVFGYLVGYFIIALVLLPIYYKMNLTSIYTYLDKRFGQYAYKTGASFFLISRTLGSAFRLFLVANILQIIIFDALNLPFYITVAITLLLIWVYTFRGGMKTIVWTDTLQTFFMLAAVMLTIFLIIKTQNMTFTEAFSKIRAANYTKIFFFENALDKNYFWKQFIGGMFIAIVMTGLDQDMMQKNLTCRTLKDAQKNMFWFSIVLVVVNYVFLILGAFLHFYASQNNIPIPQQTDNLYPMLATQGYLSVAVGILFVLGLVAAAYSSADSALTALTTSFCIDILSIERFAEQKAIKIRKITHLAMMFLMFVVILVFKALNNQSVIQAVLKIAGFTYGPILGLFAFGILTRLSTKDKLVPYIAILSVGLSFLLNFYAKIWFNGYQLGLEILVVNAFLTFTGLWLFSKKQKKFVSSSHN